MKANLNIPDKMTGMVFLGGKKVVLNTYDVPKPGHGQALIKMKASGLCGSDLKAIYYEIQMSDNMLIKGPAYDGVIGGHEPCGQIVAVGEGVLDFEPGDRVVVYHIQGCGNCENCRKGFMINCTSPRRGAYGWQRDGGHADYILAEQSALLKLPSSLTYADGAMVACGFGTAFQGLARANVSARDRVLVMGLGPVGQAVVMLAKGLGAEVIGVDVVDERIRQAKELGADHVIKNSENMLAEVSALTDGLGTEVAIDCSGNADCRRACLLAARVFGRVVFIGELGTVMFRPSEEFISKQLTLFGSWVTSLEGMRSVLEFLDRKHLHPEKIITHRYRLSDAQKAYDEFAGGKTGKVIISMEDEN